MQGDLEAAPGLQHGSAQIVMDAESNRKRKYELVPVPLDGGYGWVIVACAASLSLLLLW